MSQLSAEEQKAVVTAFDKRDQILASGLRLAGQKYFGISVDGSVIQLKKGVCGSSYLVWHYMKSYARREGRRSGYSQDQASYNCSRLSTSVTIARDDCSCDGVGRLPDKC